MKFDKGKKFIPFLLILLLSANAAGQSSEINYKLALEFFQNKEFQKSSDLLEELYKKEQSQRIYLPYFNSLLALELYDEAIGLVKKQIKKNYGDPIYLVDHGYALKLSGNEKKANGVYQNAIKDVLPRAQDVIDLSNSFQRRNELDYAILCLKKGKKITPSYGYQFEIAELYYQKGMIEDMISEYLDLLSINDAYLQNVQNALNTAIYQDLNKKYVDELNNALLRKIQRDPDRIVFSELLIWHYLQQKDFKKAIVQTKALDRRFDEGGKRFLGLGKLCLSNREYDLAMECYQYLIDNGPSSMHYISARILMTETIKEKIISSPYDQNDLDALEWNYMKTLDDIGRTGATIRLQIGLAEVWAFYLNKPELAIDILEKALTSLPLNDVDKASCKLMLADILLRENEVWEASLLYSQVEKDFKYEALGDEAKFKNAKVYFFTGDYDWTKAQLDILKGSTSKLIANDAMRLSLLISDNLAFDTTGAALKVYAAALLQYEQNDLMGAQRTLDSMKRIYLAHNIIDEVYYLLYRIHMHNQELEEARLALTTIIENYPQDILADEAVFNLGILHEQYLNNNDQAMVMYKKLISDYPASIYVAEARKRYRTFELKKSRLDAQEKETYFEGNESK